SPRRHVSLACDTADYSTCVSCLGTLYCASEPSPSPPCIVLAYTDHDRASRGDQRGTSLWSPRSETRGTETRAQNHGGPASATRTQMSCKNERGTTKYR